MHTPTSRRRRIGSAIAGTALAAGLVLAAPLAASAHVTVAPDTDAVAGGYGVLTFAFSHGCDGSPTTSLDIEIPDGLASVSPTIEAGWSIDVTRDGEDGLVKRVVYTAEEPVESGLRATISLGVKYEDDTAGQTLAFPVTQVCESGSTEWTQVPADGQDAEELESPAPAVTVGEATAESSGEHSHDADADTEDDTASADAASAVGIGLGSAGFVLGAAALVVATVALRRKKA
ncbi:uncharacterized protein YcnI [Microbacterium endophyticum]|uniref:Uncharacterized protein YcnI n=1 Tax=Microbacterium endophyticum TaxID=1526412 RepID=A0A7W4YM13_9MICO|nr:YcnI family protein [Microbacterium endophyticum]MBB2976000.1 uncharacterized protein YcnI [Microbacterium endophyticum]NIK35081.1 uncharacterized protein YcnI [Microbacterium endophyticum]